MRHSRTIYFIESYLARSSFSLTEDFAFPILLDLKRADNIEQVDIRLSESFSLVKLKSVHVIRSI